MCCDRRTGLIPGVITAQFIGASFSTVRNLAKTSWFTTPGDRSDTESDNGDELGMMPFISEGGEPVFKTDNAIWQNRKGKHE